MSKKIKVVATPSETSERCFEYSVEDMGFTIEEWENLTDEEKESAIQKELDGENEQPYWQLDKIKE